LDVLVNAAASFSATIQQQLETLRSGPSPAELAEKTINYAEAKTAYFNALRAELPELMKIATGRRRGPLRWTRLLRRFAVAGEDQVRERLKRVSIRILMESILLDRAVKPLL
jgi:hypothetical protein